MRGRGGEHILALPLVARGDLGHVYDLGEQFLIVASDHISVSGAVLPTPIPQRGRMVTQLSAFWFRRTVHIIPNHDAGTVLDDLPPSLAARSMVVRKASPLPITVEVRGNLAGSAWEQYTRTGTVGGVRQPPRLQFGDELPEPVFVAWTKALTPAEASQLSHPQLCDLLGDAEARKIREVSLELYRFAAAWSIARRVVVADARFEFGRCDGGLLLAGEALTPETSRLWYSAVGADESKPLSSLDTHNVRDWLASVGWSRLATPPELPAHLVRETSHRYRDAFRQLTAPALPSAPATTSAELG